MPEMNRRSFLVMSAGAALSCTGALGDDAPSAAVVNGEQLTQLTIAEAARRIRAKKLTSTQLTKAVLDRIATYNSKINAYITVMSDEALRQAAELDAEAARGEFRGPIHGIPLALKDNIDTANARTTAGSAVYEDRFPAQDAAITKRLVEAGAVIIGKTNMHEFAMGHTSASTYFGPVRNPWALDHIPAGSSGGSGAAVAADMCLGALGTDTGGSVRMPAAYCSVVGLKPTYGLVSIRGIVPLTYSLDHCGPMAKTVEDAAILLKAMAGYDKMDVASVEHPAEDYVAALRQPVSNLTLGIPRAPFFDLLDYDTAKAVDAAIEVLRGMVGGVKTVHLPPTMSGGYRALGSAEIEAYHQRLFREDSQGYSMQVRRSIGEMEKNLNDVSTEACSSKVVDYVLASWKLQLTRKTIDDTFDSFDLVVLPTMRITPETITDALRHDEQPQPHEPEYDSNCTPFNIFGIPAISIPCGFTATGLPIGLMIAGPRFSEGKILALAHAYEKATQWHMRKPVLRPDMSVPPVKRML